MGKSTFAPLIVNYANWLYPSVKGVVSAIQSLEEQWLNSGTAEGITLVSRPSCLWWGLSSET